MQEILTPDMEKKIERITFDYIYKYEKKYIDRIKRHISSTSEMGHFLILESMINHELIPYDSDLYTYIANRDVLNACNYLASLGDMSIYNSGDINIFHCPVEMSDYQKFRMRLYYEYFNKTNQLYEISSQTTEGPINYGIKVADSFLEEQAILDDDYMLRLAKKYPDGE